MRHLLLLLFPLCLAPLGLAAQYRGGAHDGHATLQAKGILNSLPAIYSGGTDDGHALAVSGLNHAPPDIYAGGSDDGFAGVQAKGDQNILPGIYAGGADDGMAMAGGGRIQNSFPDIYSGGSDDGHAAAAIAGMNAEPPIYSGGPNDGVDAAEAKGGTHALPSIYAGGADDGYAFTVSLGQHHSEPEVVQMRARMALLQLSAAWFNDDAVLSWEAGSNALAERFEPERSEDEGRSFEPIGSVAPNEDDAQPHYRFTDAGAYRLPGRFVLYRLKCVEMSGEFRYSAIVRLDRDRSAPMIAAYPNPSSGRFTLALLNAPDLSGYTYQLSSAEGRIIRKGTITASHTAFDLSGFAAATYRLSLFQGDRPVRHFTILLIP